MTIPLRVLIVEDSEDDALLLVRELKKGGFEPVYERVETLPAMSAALNKQTWDIVLSDYVMPHFSGMEALKLLKAKAQDTPCIIISGKITEETAVDALRAGANDYISKDNLRRLNPAVSRELNERVIRRQHKEAEIKLQAREEQYRTVIRTAMDGFWVTDTKGNILEVNDAYCRLAGYTRDELLKMHISDIETKETPEEIAQHIQRVIKNGGDHFMTQHRCKDGRLVDLDISATYLDIEGGRFFVFLRDITEQKNLEKKLKEKIADLEKFNKVAVDRELMMMELKERIKELEKNEEK